MDGGGNWGGKQVARGKKRLFIFVAYFYISKAKIWTLNKNWETTLVYVNVERWTLPFKQNWATKTSILPIINLPDAADIEEMAIDSGPSRIVIAIETSPIIHLTLPSLYLTKFDELKKKSKWPIILEGGVENNLDNSTMQIYCVRPHLKATKATLKWAAPCTYLAPFGSLELNFNLMFIVYIQFISWWHVHLFNY